MIEGAGCKAVDMARREGGGERERERERRETETERERSGYLELLRSGAEFEFQIFNPISLCMNRRGKRLWRGLLLIPSTTTSVHERSIPRLRHGYSLGSGCGEGERGREREREREKLN